MLKYFIIGCVDVFTFIGQLEFLYEQASVQFYPSRLLPWEQSEYVLVNVVTDFSSKNGGDGWIPDNLNNRRLDCFFWLLAGLSVVNLGFYVLVARWYT
ncbi:Protein NRT1/ PTR FAMILY 8.2 [Linum perenne]